MIPIVNDIPTRLNLIYIFKAWIKILKPLLQNHFRDITWGPPIRSSFKQDKTFLQVALRQYVEYYRIWHLCFLIQLSAKKFRCHESFTFWTMYSILFIKNIYCIALPSYILDFSSRFIKDLISTSRCRANSDVLSISKLSLFSFHDSPDSSSTFFKSASRVSV